MCTTTCIDSPISSTQDKPMNESCVRLDEKESQHKSKVKKHVGSKNLRLSKAAEKLKHSKPLLTREQRQYFHLLKSAQDGNLNEVKNLLSQGLNINYKDFYGWTALMCAAKEGHSEMVNCLLENGADLKIVNSDGHSAAWLAENARHHSLAEKLLNFSPHEATSSLEHHEPTQFYCQTCKSEFYAADETCHVTSIVHLLNTSRKHSKHFYTIPETNKGFQMLLKTGWEKDRGLGPRGDGCKYPVKTILKQDRAGIGVEESNKKKAKVTHFNPHDTYAVKNVLCHNLQRKMSARKAAHYAAKGRERKQKSFEHKLRLELNGGFN
ncbi:hypothetical protein Btru_067490 [Bulinus truncatus]|nr:hypothetical protein Btru_067490 [Bulinus truncatus]